jgi:membrane-bound metal-dependent hydrolase YbcI (DUF457 family)
MVPDIDIRLEDKDASKLSFSIAQDGYKRWVPVVYLTNILYGFYKKVKGIGSVQMRSKVSHRGITHTFWFSLVFGFLLSGIASVILGALTLLELTQGVNVTESLTMLLQVPPEILIPYFFVVGFCSVVFHCVGDLFTPTGIHFMTDRTDYGFSFNQFYAKNEVANRSALPLGLVFNGYAIFAVLSAEQFATVYLVGGFFVLLLLLIPIWLLFVRTRLGKWVYRIYDFINE